MCTKHGFLRLAAMQGEELMEEDLPLLLAEMQRSNLLADAIEMVDEVAATLLT